MQALMLAASVDCTEGLTLLIAHGATIELQVMGLQTKEYLTFERQMELAICSSASTMPEQLTE